MAQPYSTGPCLIHVGIDGTPVFFGTAEQGVDIEEKPEYEPVMNDLAGPRKPFDQMAAGNDAILSFTVTRWNEAIHAQMAAYANPQAGTRGTEGSFDRGTMMIYEGGAYPVWLEYTRSSLAAYATMPAGYHFYSCILLAPLRLTPGLRPYKVQFVLQALSTYQVGNLGFTTYDHDMSGLGASD